MPVPSMAGSIPSLTWQRAAPNPTAPGGLGVDGKAGRGRPAEAQSARRHFKFLSHYSMAWPGPRLPRLPVD